MKNIYPKNPKILKNILEIVWDAMSPNKILESHEKNIVELFIKWI